MLLILLKRRHLVHHESRYRNDARGSRIRHDPIIFFVPFGVEPVTLADPISAAQPNRLMRIRLDPECVHKPRCTAGFRVRVIKLVACEVPLLFLWATDRVEILIS